MVKLKNIPGLSAIYLKAADNAPAHDNSSGATEIKDLGLVDKLNLRTNVENQVVRKALKYAVGTDLPVDYNTVNVAGNRSIIWLGPDEWLILGETGSSVDIMAALNNKDAGHIAVVDVSDALGIVSIKGPHARDVLAKHCAIDFHVSEFKKGMCAQSIMAHAGITVVVKEDDEFLIIGRSSFMPYLVDLVKDASIEYGFNYNPA